MSGILGMWNLSGMPVERSLLRRMSATLSHRGPDGEYFWSDGPIGMAAQLLRVTPESQKEVQPFVAASGTVLVFDGRLDNRDELITAFRELPGVTRDCTDSLLVACAYDVYGDGFAARLNGDFAIGLFDPKRRRMVVARDGIGVRPIYFYRADDLFIFASEIKAIVAHPEVPIEANEDLLAEFTILGLFGEEPGSTFLKHIEVLRPGYFATVTPERFQATQYWDFDLSRSIRLKSFPEYTEAFRELFTTAVRRRLRSADPVAVSVSGGLDSSSIFCMAQQLRREPGTPNSIGLTCSARDGSPADEEEFLVAIEKQYSLQIDRIPAAAAPGFVDSAAKELYHIESPLLNMSANQQDYFARQMKARGVKLALSGLWGDEVLFDWSYLIDRFWSFSWKGIVSDLNGFADWYDDIDAARFKIHFLRSLLRSFVPSSIVPLLKPIRSRLRRYESDCAWYADSFRRRAYSSSSKYMFRGLGRSTAHAKSVYEGVRSRLPQLVTQSCNKLAAMHQMDMAFPFLDRDLLSFLIAVPGDILTYQGVPRALLRESLRGVLPNEISDRRSKGDSTHLATAGLSQDYPAVVAAFHSSCETVSRGYAEREKLISGLQALRSEIDRGNLVVPWKIHRVYSMEYWLRTVGAFREQQLKPIKEIANAVR